MYVNPSHSSRQSLPAWRGLLTLCQSCLRTCQSCLKMFPAHKQNVLAFWNILQHPLQNQGSPWLHLGGLHLGGLHLGGLLAASWPLPQPPSGWA